MSVCTNCGYPIPEGGKFCPVCGSPAPVAEESFSPPTVPLTREEPEQQEAHAQEEAAPNWYQAAPQEEASYTAAPVYVPAKPSIGGIFDFYRKAFDVLKQKPIKLWGLSLLYLVIAAVVSSLGSFVPIITVPIVLVLSLGFTGVLLDGYHGKEVRSEQLFQGFKKEEVVRNGAGMCWMELWTLIWSFVPVMNIIKYYSYCFTPYILLTDKEITATEALRKSMRMTDGYKGKLFGADVLLVIGVIVVLILLGVLGQIRYVGWIFMIALFLFYIALVLFFPIFLGLVHTAFFDEISKVHEE